MRLFSYCIPIDDGAAPNPFWGVCTLVICKPVIRRVAEEGDWIVGVGSKNVGGRDYSGKLVYAMKVTAIMSLRKYDNHCTTFLKEKIPDISHSDYRRRVGDCIYDYKGSYSYTLRPGVHDDSNVDRDQRGENALLSEHFYYFGDQAVEIPKEFSALIRQGQGHQSTRNQFIKDKFVAWLQSNFEKNKIYGAPQVTIDFNVDKDGKICSTLRCNSADEDEAMDYSEEELPLSHWNYFLALESDLKVISRYVELNEGNYKTFSIGLTQLFMAACSELDVVMRQACYLLSGKNHRNMGDYSKVLLDNLPSITTRNVSIPLYNIQIQPFKGWSKVSTLSWWDSYNHVKHHRNIHYQEANLENTLNAMAALHILIFELIRLHRGKEEDEFASKLIYKYMQPRQELFLLDEEEQWRDIAEGKRTVIGHNRHFR